MKAILLTLAGLACAAGPLPRCSVEQAGLLEQRNKLWEDGHEKWRTGEQARAIRSLNRVMEIELRLFGPWSRAAEVTADRLGDWFRIREEWGMESECRRFVLTARRRMHGDGDWRVADARLELQEAERQGRLKPAQREEQRRAAALNSEAVALHREGKTARAVPLLRRALELNLKVLGRDHPDYARALANLAALLEQMGDYQEALPLSRQALSVTGEVFGGGHPVHAEACNGLGLLLSAMGGHEEALPLLRRALAIRLAALGEMHPTSITALQNLATVESRAGRYKEALARLRHALSRILARGGERDPACGACLGNLAALHLKLGDHRSALHLQERALAHSRDILGPAHPHYAQGLSGLAGLFHEMGRPGAALPLQEQAMSLLRRRLTLDAAFQPERQQLAAARKQRLALDFRLSLRDEAPRFSHEHVLSWKGAVFATLQARRLFLHAEADDATRADARALLAATRALASLASRPGPSVSDEAARIARTKEDLEVRLSRASAAFRQALRPPSGEGIRAALPPGVALVDLLAYMGEDPAAPPGVGGFAHRLAAWVLRAGEPTVRIDLGPMRPIEEAIASWRRVLQGGGATGTAPARLREAVWAPLQRHLAGAKLILISPDGALGRLPFAALPGTKKPHLLEEVALAVLPIPQVLPQLLQPVKGEASLLTLGGVEFGAGAGTWAALPATGPEADAVGACFRGHSKAAFVRLTGAKATKASVAEALPKHRFAHLATHGYFAPASMKSALGRDHIKPDLFGREGVTGWHPGLLSGLALAGANEPTPEADGILTALEIAELDLANVELAVLSACQTGLGQEAAGEGILGLQRAFAMAGCKSVVSSLWSVDDAATSVLMERFYHHLWEKKLSKIESLRQAQLDVLRHPEWVEDRVKGLAGVRGLRREGKAEARVVGERKERRSPVAWWGAWQLSGDWR